MAAAWRNGGRGELTGIKPGPFGLMPVKVARRRRGDDGGSREIQEDLPCMPFPTITP
jgi:hypothetical protein